MKSFIIFLLVIGFSVYAVNNDAYGIYIPQTPEKLWEQSQIIFVGNITSVKVLEFGKSSNSIGNYTLSLDEYTVNIEEFVKNPVDLNVITVRQPTISLPGSVRGHVSFELEDRVLFYVKNFDSINTYSSESFKIPKQCDTQSVLEQPRITFGNNFTRIQDGINKDNNFTANIPIQFNYERDMRTLSGHDFVIDTNIIKITNNTSEDVFQKRIPVNIEPCEWIGSAKWDFVPQPGKYRMNTHISEAGGGSTSSRNFIVNENPDFKYPTPGSTIIADLYPIKKQFEAGLGYEELSCNEDLVLITKYDGTPACVKYSTALILIEREWATCDDGIKHQRGHPCGPRSSPGIPSSEQQIEQLANLTLTISNQSFEISPVDIAVRIDGVIVIDEKFEVGSQHNFHHYEFQLEKGTHTIHANSVLGDVNLEQEFEIDEEKWGYIFYVNNEEDPPIFTLEISEKPFGFL